MRHRGFIAIVIATGVVIAACGGDDPTDPTSEAEPDATEDDSDNTEEPEADPITIGISMPLSGDFSEPGQGIQRGYETWAAMVNDSGGLLGRPVELIFRDDASDPNVVVSDYEALITQDQVDLVFGPFSTRLVVPAAEVAEDHGMLFVEPAGAAAEVFEQGFQNLFYAAPAVADDHYNYLADWILALPEDERPQTAAYPALDDPFAQGTAWGLRDKLEAAGIETVYDDVYPPETTDYTAIAAAIADREPDLIVGGTQFQDSVGMIRAFQDLGYQPDMAAFSTGPTLPEFDEAIAGATEGILSPVGWSLEAEFGVNQEFRALNNELHGQEPGEDEANGFTVGQIVADAVEAVGCAEQGDCQQQLVDYIRQTEFDTIVGPLSFDETGKPQSAHMILQWQSDGIEIVLPADPEVQTAEIAHPKAAW